MIGRRVRPNARMPLNIARRVPVPDRSLRRRGQGIVHKQRAVSGDTLAGLEAFENLPKSVLLKADLDRSLGKAAAVGRHPYGHGAVTLADDARFRDGGVFISSPVRMTKVANIWARSSRFGSLRWERT